MVLVVNKSVYEEIKDCLLKSHYLRRLGYPGNYKYIYEEPDGMRHGSNSIEKKSDVKHSGEYVLTSSGSKDFGEITPKISKQIGRQAGKIRLRIGQQKGNKEDYGELHMERDNRLKDLQSAGFKTARDFTEFVCKDYDAIYPNGAGLIIYKKGQKHNQLYVQLIPAKDSNDFYDVKTGVASNRNQMKNKTPLWVNPDSSVFRSKKESAHDNQFSKESPLRDLAGVSDNSTIPPSTDSVKRNIKKSIYDQTREILKAIGA